MAIIFHENSKEFHLFNKEISYVIHILPNGQPGHVYYGKRLRDREDFSYMMDTASWPICAWPLPEEPEFSLERVRQEYPAFGRSDFRQPAFEILQENGSHISDFSYEDYEITLGKPDMPGLPHSYAENNEQAQTLRIYMRDDLTQVKMTLIYTIFENLSAIARSVIFENQGNQTLKLNRAMSAAVDFPDRDMEWMQFSGAWARERAPKVRPLESGITGIESMRGHSGSQENPFVILKKTGTGEDDGEAFGFSFVYSGNFLAQAEVDTYGTTRFIMGINPREFCWKLAPSVTFQTPEVLMTWSDRGLNGLSHTIHTLLGRHVARGPWRDQPRPILLNNWEATGMQFTEDDIVRIAAKGAEAGVELFVLDDGWFGKRSEVSGLGDWFPDRSKLPNGLPGLSERISGLGLKFGIWIEPEMVNEDSELYRAHPEYVLCTPDRGRSLGRNQMVLDFSNPEVVDCIWKQLCASFEGADISYIKWDMNRSITECYSAHWPADQQGEVYHRYILGVYSLYEKLLAKYPGILVESCSSGGCRFDAGMLYYAPQAWCSDDTDAVQRMKIQYGSSYGYPVSSWGSHVSVCPNQQLGRSTPLKTRANVAFFGAFGYEMDLNALTEDEMRMVKQQITFMKQYRKLIQFGTFYRLVSPYGDEMCAWMVVSENKKESVVGVYQILNGVNRGFTRIQLQGLDPQLDYRIDEGQRRGGDDLMNYGLMPMDTAAHVKISPFQTGRKMELSGDFDSYLYVLKAEDRQAKTDKMSQEA